MATSSTTNTTTSASSRVQASITTNTLTPTTKSTNTQTSSSAIPISSATISSNPKKLFDVLKMKKRPVSTSDSDSELSCPICFDLIAVAQVTKCGHSFCQACIVRAIEHTHRCPKCNTPLNSNKDIFPNFALNQVIERIKDEVQSKKCKLSQISKTSVIEYISATKDELVMEDVDQLLQILSHKKEELKYSTLKLTETLLLDFLKHVRQVKTDELSKLQHELQILNEDCKNCEEQINFLNDQNQGDDGDAPINLDLDGSFAFASKLQAQFLLRKRILNRYFDELRDTYLKFHNKDFEELLIDCTKNSPNTNNSKVLEKLREIVSKVTDYSQFKCLASVNYSNDAYNLSSIVSSIDFDRSYEHFACVGVTKKIKIYDFNTIVERSAFSQTEAHYPLYEMQHNAKLSCVSWNKYFKNQIVCSDYDGIVTLWDSEVGTLLKTYQEHEKRCWGVQFSTVDPRLLASASDDSKVKLWSTNSDYSVVSIDAKSNVCCVSFKPDSKFHLLFGTADHSIHYYDLRNTKEAIRVFKGHKKAVSYVKFSNNNEFVSASTDSTLKSWKLNEGQCIRSYTGHTNEKNFVGLEAHDGYIVSGSENNNVYLYYNELAKPLLNYKFDDNSAPCSDKFKRDDSTNDFVSALCWSDQNILLAANSQGIVKVLELS